MKIYEKNPICSGKYHLKCIKREKIPMKDEKSIIQTYAKFPTNESREWNENWWKFSQHLFKRDEEKNLEEYKKKTIFFIWNLVGLSPVQISWLLVVLVVIPPNDAKNECWESSLQSVNFNLTIQTYIPQTFFLQNWQIKVYDIFGIW